MRVLTNHAFEPMHQQQTSKGTIPEKADRTLPQRSIPHHSNKVTTTEPASRLSSNGTTSPRSSLPAVARRGRADSDLWSDTLGAGLQAAMRTVQDLLQSSEQALTRVNRVFGPLPGGFPPGVLSPLSWPVED